MFRKSLIILFIIQISTSACEKGCLVCTAEDVCQFCDSFHSYYLSVGTCVLSTDSQCQYLNQAGQCLICNSDYFVDASTLKCVAISTANLVEHCVTYESSQNCSLCSDGFYISNGACTKLEKKIQDCLFQKDNQFCSVCSKGMLLNAEKTQCLKPDDFRNCQFYSEVICESCSNEYLFNRNQYLDYFLNLGVSGTSFQLENQINRIISGDIRGVVPAPCQGVTVSYCQVIESSSKCKTCLVGYYRDTTGNCKLNPLASIPSCEIYSSPTACFSCMQGFYQKTKGECKSVTAIDNCELYSQVSEQSTCTKCANTHYLNKASNRCETRVISLSIEFCSILNQEGDNCLECQSGYQITDDKKKCLSILSNCFDYNDSTKDSTVLTCKKCENLFYIKDAVCTGGTVANCISYQVSQDTCIQCQEGYYIDASNSCNAHNSLELCMTYSTNQAHQCTKCQAQNYLFQQIVGCEPITSSIANCTAYSNATTCSTCASGYYLSANTCLAIPSNLNCLAYNSSNACITCAAGYFLDTTCKPIWDIINDNCEVITANTNVCTRCKTNSIPLTQKSKFKCLKQTEHEITIPKKDNCLKMNAAKDNCVQCAESYYLLAGACALSQTNKTKQLVTASNANLTGVAHFVISGIQFNVDIASTVTDANCDIITTALGFNLLKATNEYDQQKQLYCLTCPTGFHMDSKLSYYSQFDPSSNLIFPTVNKLGFIYQLGVCATTTAKTFLPGGSTQANCSTYEYVAAGNAFYCKKCIWGMTGENKEDTHGSYIQCDQQIVGCNTQNKYGGELVVGNVIGGKAFMRSCHTCTDATKIPFIFEVSMANLTLKPYGLVEGAKPNEGSASYYESCIQPNRTNFKIKAEDWEGTFPDNCALGAVITEAILKYMPGDRGIYCQACKPGYFASYESNKIIACDPIQHCDLSSEDKWFNSCRTCAQGYAWFYDTTAKSILYDRCEVNNVDTNCLVISTENIQQITGTAFSNYLSKNCFLCKKGYTFNLDGKCESINAPRCKDGQYHSMTEFITTAKDAFLIYDLYPIGVGCNQCEIGYLGVEEASSSTFYICVQSTYVQNQNYSQLTKYVQNCLHYWHTAGELNCLACAAGYIPSQDQKHCVLQTVFPGCTTTNSSVASCITCNTGYVLVQSVCQVQSILNCANFTSNSSSQNCESCASGYYLKDNQCFAGSVDNCLTYGSNGVCSQCKSTYLLLETSLSEKYCISIKSSLNCSSMGVGNSPNVDELSCNSGSCSSGYVLTADRSKFDEQMCMTLTSIPNCLTYNINSTVKTSTFMCSVCAEGFYLMSHRCKERTKNVNWCTTYNPASDVCQACQQGYYLNTNLIECVAYPIGIQSCESYVDPNTCAVCLQNYLLSSNVCVLIPDSQRVAHCLQHQENLVCKVCDRDYFLENNLCIASKAKNCSTYIDINNCQACLPGYGLKSNLTTATVDCVIVNNPNCLSYENNYPFNCIDCNTGFYVSQGQCVVVETTISNCYIYVAKNKCKTCMPGYVLSLDTLTCPAHNNANGVSWSQCSNLKQVQTPTCIACEFGYYFDNDQCVECSQSSLNSGCLSCDYTNTTKCKICKSGYYQTKDGECNKIDTGTTEGGGGDNENGGNKGNGGSSTEKFATLFILLLSILF